MKTLNEKIQEQLQENKQVKKERVQNIIWIVVLIIMFSAIVYLLPNALDQNMDKYEPTQKQLEVNKVN